MKRIRAMAGVTALMLAAIALTGCCPLAGELRALRSDLATLRGDVKRDLAGQTRQLKALNEGLEDVDVFLRNNPPESARTDGNDTTRVIPVRPDPDPVTVRDPDDGPVVVDTVPPVKPKGAMTLAEKEAVVKKALLNLQRCFVSSDDDVSAARDTVETALAEPGFNVVQADRAMDFDPDEKDQDKFRTENDCNLVFLLKGETQQKDKFGEFFSYECKLAGKVLNLYTHQIIARKTLTQRGQRKTDPDQAAETSVVAAAQAMSEYLIKEIARKWQATSLVKCALTITDVEDAGVLNGLRAGLQNRVGIYYVSLEKWDEVRRTAEFEVLARFDVKEHLPAYVDEMRLGKVRVQSVKENAIIKAIREKDLED